MLGVKNSLRRGLHLGNCRRHSGAYNVALRGASCRPFRSMVQPVVMMRECLLHRQTNLSGASVRWAGGSVRRTTDGQILSLASKNGDAIRTLRA